MKKILIQTSLLVVEWKKLVDVSKFSFIYCFFQEVRFKMIDPKCYSSKTSTLEHGITLSHDFEPTAFCKNTNKLFGVSPSDIDKYSRVVFPVCFVCFNLMYWIIYLHISDVLDEGIVPLGSKWLRQKPKTKEDKTSRQPRTHLNRNRFLYVCECVFVFLRGTSHF